MISLHLQSTSYTISTAASARIETSSSIRPQDRAFRRSSSRTKPDLYNSFNVLPTPAVMDVPDAVSNRQSPRTRTLRRSATFWKYSIVSQITAPHQYVPFPIFDTRSPLDPQAQRLSMKPSSCSALTKLVMLDLNRCFWDVTLDEQSYGEEGDLADHDMEKMALTKGFPSHT